MNAITFDYRANVYVIRRAGQAEERAAMNPRAAAHVAVILAAAGWQIDHVGLIPEPTASDDERLVDLVVVAPNIVQMHTQRQRRATKTVAPPEETALEFDDTLSVAEAAEVLGVTQPRIYQLAATGTLPSQRVKRGRRSNLQLDRAGVMDYLARKNPPPSEDGRVSVADQTHTVEEAAAILYMSTPLVYKYIQSGQLKAERVRPNGFGRWQYRIKNADLLTFADEINE